jgi:hypothetical protein
VAREEAQREECGKSTLAEEATMRSTWTIPIFPLGSCSCGGRAMASRDISRRRLVESMQLEEHLQMEDDPISPEKVVRGTWSHPNPSLIYLYNPRL